MLKDIFSLRIHQAESGIEATQQVNAISYLAIIMALFQFILGIYFYNTEPKTYDFSKLEIVISTFSIFVFFTLLHCLSCHSRKLRFILHGSSILIYSVLWMFQFQTHSLLSCGLLEENFFEIFAPEAVSTILGIAGYYRLLFGVLCFLALLPIEYHIIKRQRFGRLVYKKTILFSLAITYGLILYLCPVIDPPAYFIQDSIDMMQLEYRVDKITLKGNYPYLNDAIKDVPKIESQAHVFLLQIESFNKNFVETASPDGIPFTPFYNSLISEGFYVEKFYGPSIQTVRGQFMIHCGIPESLTVKAFIAFYKHQFHCLPEIMKEAGYRTLYFHNYADGNFDNGGPFMEKNGFEFAKAMDHEFLRRDDKPYIWGWGLQDNKFYLKFFNFLDQMEMKNPGVNRYFSSLLTVSSHMMFDHVPMRQRYLYHKPKTTLESYSNAIRITDEYLRVFMAQLHARPYLENSIIIITGDHSYPVGEHGNYNNAVGYYEESFRTPFLILWKNHIKPHRETQIAFSQLDIAPTLLKLLSLNVPNHFKGVSMFDLQKEQHLIPLIQPYGGVYTGSVLYPFKYIQHLASGREFLFNLDLDPKEKSNLIRNFKNVSLLQTFRDSIQNLYYNQAILKKDQIWPKNY